MEWRRRETRTIAIGKTTKPHPIALVSNYLTNTDINSGGRLALAIHRCRKPTIAAMQGSAVGLGMTMSLPAAIRIGCQKSKYGFVFPRRGLTMESSSSFFLPRLIGYSNALYLITTGGTFPPTSPHFGTLFQETYPDPNQVVARALELAMEVAENVSPMASYLSRELMWRNPGSAEETHLVDSAVLYHMFSGRYVFSYSFHQASPGRFTR